MIAFQLKKKAGAVFVDLIAAYDTVWHRGLTCKLLRLLPDRHMVHMIMEIVGIRSFTLTTENVQKNRLQCLKNGVPQGSVLASLLFNIYISDLLSWLRNSFHYMRTEGGQTKEKRKHHRKRNIKVISMHMEVQALFGWNA